MTAPELCPHGDCQHSVEWHQVAACPTKEGVVVHLIVCMACSARVAFEKRGMGWYCGAVGISFETPKVPRVEWRGEPQPPPEKEDGP